MAIVGHQKFTRKLLGLQKVHGVPFIAIALAHFFIEVLLMALNKCNPFPYKSVLLMPHLAFTELCICRQFLTYVGSLFHNSVCKLIFTYV